MALIKSMLKYIVQLLANIFNVSFETVFPSKIKTVKVIPIYQSGDKHLFTNYRPISLPQKFSKIPEKQFAHRLDKFLAKKSFMLCLSVQSINKTDYYCSQMNDNC